MSEHDYTDEHVEADANDPQQDAADEARAAGEQRRDELPGLGYTDKFPAPDEEAPAEDEDVTEDSTPADADEPSGEGDEDVDEDEVAPAPDSSPTSAPAPARQPWTLGQGE